MGNDDVKLKITQIYTNRCLSFHHLNQQSSVISDATFVIENLDSFNAKALFRRSNAYKQQERFADAVADLEVLVGKTADGKSHAKDLEATR